MRVGILAIHGSVSEHANALKKLKIEPVEVRAPEDFANLDGLILPGGESTTISDLASVYGLEKAIVRFANKQPTTNDQQRLMTNSELARTRNPSTLVPRPSSLVPPIFGTCAGIILLARFGLLDVEIARNAYGAQIHSFETEIKIPLASRQFPAVFIRAPKIKAVGKNVEVLAKYDGAPVLIRQGNIFGATFHPELTNDTRIHRLIFGTEKS